MKKLNIILIAILLALLACPINAESSEDVVNMNVSIVKSDVDEYTVSLPESNLFAETKPTMTVNTGFSSTDKIVVKDSSNTKIAHSVVDGVVSFTVKKGGTYTITIEEETSPVVTPDTTPYRLPKTGI